MWRIPLIGLLGRLSGFDFGGILLSRIPVSITLGLLFLPDYYLAGIIALGFLLAEAMRDSIFELLDGWDWKTATRISIRTLWYMPLFIGMSIYLDNYTLFIFMPFLRAPIQFVCSFIPLPKSTNSDKLKDILGGRAEWYEFFHNASIGTGLVGIAL